MFVTSRSFNHGGRLGHRVRGVTFFFIMEVGLGLVSVTSHFFNYGGRLEPCDRDVKFFNHGVPLSLSVD